MLHVTHHANVNYPDKHGSSDPVDPSASLTLLGHHIEPELLLQGSSDGTAHRVSLPAEGGDDFIDARAPGLLEHVDQLGLLAVGTHAVGLRLGLADFAGTTQFWLAFNRGSSLGV